MSERTVIAISGRPGTGKTTLVREFMKGHEWKRVEPAKQVVAEYCEALDLYILGKYDEGEVFAGTDRLSMSVQPEVIKWLETHKSNVLFEGDRLTGSKMYDYLLDNEPNVHFIVIQAKEETLKARYQERGSDQPDQFLKAKETKIGNILNNFDYQSSMDVFDNNTPEDQKKILDCIRGFLS